MAAFTPALAPPGLVQPPPQASAAELAKRTQIKDAARQFETQFLSQMLQHMFAGVSTDGPFGGGFGEEMFRSLQVDEYARSLTQRGGVGIAASVTRELIRLQEASRG